MNMKTVVTYLLLLTSLVGGSRPTPPSVSLHDAARTGNLEAVQQHIKAASNLNEKEAASGGRPLHTSAAFGQLEALRALIQAGADVNARNNDGGTPIITAAFLCRTEIVQYLLAHGADKSAKNNAGATALDSVSGPFDQVKGIYDFLQSALGPVGLKLDYEQIQATRPKIASLLR
jgi:uncharacterized protein